MYWCKPKPIIAIYVSMLFMAACKPEVKQGSGHKYFDLKKYFETEAARLNASRPNITKTVTFNGQPEKKMVTIKNWEQEFDLFSGSDINRPSWRDSYRMIARGDSVTYTAVDDNLRTRRIIIVQKNHKVVHVDISNFTQNLLYKTTEHLVYIPDSVYRIEKHQSVKILGDNDYQIYGKLK